MTFTKALINKAKSAGYLRALKTPKGNNSISNFEGHNQHGKYFMSYGTLIAYIDNETGVTLIDIEYWDYSNTTMRYLKQFIGHCAAETRRRLDQGHYIGCRMN